MVLMWSIFWFVIWLNSSEAVEKSVFPKLRDNHKITVGLSVRKPFMMLNQNSAPTGIDIMIIENFARKLNLTIDYILVNVSLLDQTSLR